MKKEEFIQKIAGYVKKYATAYEIKVCSPIIAQAILESGWGESRLAKDYHNYFGLKCGTKWQGKSVNLATWEEYEAGTAMVISDYFRVFDNMEEGVKGYFELLQLPRYQNLKGITEPGRYLETIWADGYATSSVYVQKNMELIEQYQLMKYDENASGRSAQDVLNVMRSWIGYSEANRKFRQIIDLYNSYLPLARGYAVQYTDEWCDTAVSAAAIQAGCVDLIGTECGCEKHIEIFKEKGIWIEDGTIVPLPGDIILYNWDCQVQPNDGYSDHIGYVESVSGQMITVMEGNYNEEVAGEVIQGKYGNGEERRKKLCDMGYDPDAVQREVNRQLSQNEAPAEYYVVQENDTLSEIAKRFATTYLELAAWNGIADPNMIYVGQKIRIR
ncbi:MAG: glucosaminidase domain-containing protein [Mediterraneibacter gnavus]